MMKPRARRATIGVAALAVVLLVVLVVACWGTVRDHVEAWHFQLTRKTMEVTPPPKGFRPVQEPSVEDVAGCRLILATDSCLPVVFDSAEDRVSAFVLRDLDKEVTEFLRVDEARRVLRVNGYRILEQRFPRRAYVVIRDVDRIRELLPPSARNRIPRDRYTCPELVE